jgi:hypothetical protein
MAEEVLYCHRRIERLVEVVTKFESREAFISWALDRTGSRRDVAAICTAMFLWQAVWGAEGGSIMLQYTPQERTAIMSRARAILAETAPPDQGKAMASRRSEPELVYKTRITNDDERPRPKADDTTDVRKTDDDDAVLSAAAAAYATSNTAPGETWRTWVEKYCEYRHSVVRDALGQVLGEFRAQAREYCEHEIGIVKRELELTRREFAVLQKEAGVERALRNHQDEVAEARRLVPEVPAIAARLDAEQSSLKAEQSRLQRELDATTKKVSRLRVDQAIADYSISELRKEASKAASIELTTSSARFSMRNIDPAAARTLRDFAAQVIDGRDGGAVWPSGPGGRLE